MPCLDTASARAGNEAGMGERAHASLTPPEDAVEESG